MNMVSGQSSQPSVAASPGALSVPPISAGAAAPVDETIKVSSVNRADLSHREMEQMERNDGDLFAVFADAAGNTRVQYATFADYARVAQRQVARRREGPVERMTLFYLVGSMMISRLHNYDLYGFVHLLDHNLREVFNLRDLVDWISVNKDLFEQPMTQVIYTDEDREALYAEFDAQEGQA